MNWYPLSIMEAGGLISEGEDTRICTVFQKGGDRLEIAESELIVERFLTGKKEQAESSKVLAANQGLYNGFLAAGLIWGLLSNKTDVIVFFLICISIAGIYGAYSTKNIKLFYIQAVPAILALLLLFF